METDWVTVYEGDQRYKVDLMQEHLEVAGIKSVIIDKIDTAYAGVFEGLAQLKVHKEDEMNAREILKKYNE